MLANVSVKLLYLFLDGLFILIPFLVIHLSHSFKLGLGLELLLGVQIPHASLLNVRTLSLRSSVYNIQKKERRFREKG